MLLRIGESLSLRGPAIDKLNEGALAEQREKIVVKSLKDIQGMTLTVIDGNFPREVLANQNLAFTTYRMPARRNTSRFYDAKTKKPAARQQGTLVEGALSFDGSATQKPGFLEKPGFSTAGLSVVLSLTFVGLVLIRRRKRTAR